MSPSLMDKKTTPNQKQLRNSALRTTFNTMEKNSQSTYKKYLCDTKATVGQTLSLTGAFPVP